MATQVSVVLIKGALLLHARVEAREKISLPPTLALASSGSGHRVYSPSSPGSPILVERICEWGGEISLNLQPFKVSAGARAVNKTLTLLLLLRWFNGFRLGAPGV